MNEYSDPADQENNCYKRTSGYFGGVNTCKYVPCSEVGYCIGKRDEEHYDLLTQVEYEDIDEDADDASLDEDYGSKKKMRPSRAPKPSRTPKPARTPRPARIKPARTPRPTFYKTPRPTINRQGVTYGDRPLPLTGCAEIMDHGDCYADNECVWKYGYPPMEFADDEAYQYVNGWNVSLEYLNHFNMNANALMLIGVLLVAVFLAVGRSVFVKEEKKVSSMEVNESAYGSVEA